MDGAPGRDQGLSERDDDAGLRAWLRVEGIDPDAPPPAATGGIDAAASDRVLERDAHPSARDLADGAGVGIEVVVRMFHDLGVAVPDLDAPQFTDLDLVFVQRMGSATGLGIIRGPDLLRVVAGAMERIAEAAVAVYVQGSKRDLRGRPRAGPPGHRLRRPGGLDDDAGRPRPGGAGRAGEPVRGPGVRRHDGRRRPAGQVHRRRDHGGGDRSRGGRPHRRRPGRCLHRGRHAATWRAGIRRGPVPPRRLLRAGGEPGRPPGDAAIPGEVLVDTSVVRALEGGDLRFEPAGRRMLRGFDTPVAVWSLGSPG